MTVEAQCWNYIVTTNPIMFSVIKKFLFQKGGLKLVENKAETLYNEVSENGVKNLSYERFKTFFVRTPAVTFTIKHRPEAKKVKWHKIRIPKFGMSDGMVKHLNQIK